MGNFYTWLIFGIFLFFMVLHFHLLLDDLTGIPVSFGALSFFKSAECFCPATHDGGIPVPYHGPAVRCPEEGAVLNGNARQAQSLCTKSGIPQLFVIQPMFTFDGDF